jgi:DNA-binding MarR family transcriptional regulator
MSVVTAQCTPTSTDTDVPTGSATEVVVATGQTRRPRCRPSNRLERGIVLYLMQPDIDGSVVGEESILRMLWDLSHLGGPLLPGASFQNIREALHELATSGWIGMRLANRNEPRRFWLIPGVGRYINDPAEAFLDETESQHAAAALLAQARALLSELTEAPVGYVQLVLSKSDALATVSTEMEVLLLGWLVEHNGRDDSSREAVARALGETSAPAVSHAIRRMETEGYVARLPLPGRRRCLETVLFPAGCRRLIELLEAGSGY